MILKKLIVATSLMLALLISGCASTGTSSYGASVLASNASRDKAVINANTTQRDVKKIKQKISKLERSLRRSERRLRWLGKRMSTKRRGRLDAAIIENRKEIKRAARAQTRAERKAGKAQRKLERATRKAELAGKRENASAARQTRPARAWNISLGGSSSSLFASARSGNIDYSRYKKLSDGGFNLPAVPVKRMDKKFLRQRVDYRTTEKPGTLVVETGERFVYLVEGNGKAMRYGIGVGRAGFEWQGTAEMAWKREWPTWTPPQSMIARQPKLAKYGGANGMKGGPSNPLGARALYIFQNGKDTLYRLHGTPEWESIGTAASSGCIRLINQDIIDLYSRVKNGAKIVVNQG